jgi:two-component system C4-dicarboxylate transport response regulator DctD
LYFRFNVVTIFIPPLRERREDIPRLFEHHVLLAAGRYKREAPTVTYQMVRDLMSFDWPGNVRELGNVADRFVLGLLGRHSHSTTVNSCSGRSLKDIVGDFERSLIVEALRRHHGDVLVVSENLGLPKKTLYDKMRRHALSGDEYR